MHAAGLPLLGVTGYEGPLVDHSERPRARRVVEYVRNLRTLACAVEQEGLRQWAPATARLPVVSVGGSDLVDVVLAELGAPGPVRCRASSAPAPTSPTTTGCAPARTRGSTSDWRCTWRAAVTVDDQLRVLDVVTTDF
ncbi:hypothetical protein [Ruania albidiflava]|uniref:hypothetical protein n=1 Tax=Ruania albidiflava TaxID=366586 RepID=UPI0003B4CE2D|nr:hypothetical protein [Ruania albidiflava]